MSAPAWVAIFPKNSYVVIDWLTLSLSHLNKLTANIPYISYANPPKRYGFKRKNMIPHVRSVAKPIVPCSDRCESDCWIQKFTTPGHTFLDSTVRFEYPGRLSQEKYLRRWEGCPTLYIYIYIYICVCVFEL